MSCFSPSSSLPRPSADWKEDWEKTIRAAKQEGSVVIYTFVGLQNVERLEMSEAKKRGLPVASFATDKFKEGGLLGSAGGNIMLINRAPHPNATKVYVNWLLSREGQIAFQKLVLGGRNSLRTNIPKDDVPEHARIVPGTKYVLPDDPACSDLETMRSFVRELWKTRKQG